ncbi:MAG: C25 family cysteine peptidase, partial [Fidelibacterota bacterium]
MNFKKIILLFVFGLATATSLEMIPLNQKWLDDRIIGQYSRGTFLIVLADSYLLPYLSAEQYGGDFVAFKKSQGFDVDIISMNTEGLSSTDPTDLKSFLQAYSSDNPMLEYVLLVGDINGSFSIPTHFIPSINEDEVDVTDYPYSYFNDNPNSDEYDILNPHFIIGRWSIRNPGDFTNIKSRTIQYTRRDNLIGDELDYTSNAMLVAGNYSNSDGEEIDPSLWPVTPVWTSRWLYDMLIDSGYSHVDTVYFTAENPNPDPPLILSSWNNGVGVINYRGWGNSHGWHFPEFHIIDIQELTHGWKLPVVSSFVCNTGDFGADLNNSGPVKCFAEELTTKGTLNNPQGAVAVVGPSDLDTDTKYNNVMCGNYWMALLTEETAEIGSALHIGKQSLLNEFPQLSGHGDVVEFYHHVYSVIGDPSIPIWLLTPSELSAEIETDTQLHQSFISTVVTDENGDPIEEVVGALLMGTELVGKGLSTPEGFLDIDFSGIPAGADLSLYLNKAQFLQKKIDIVFVEDDGTPFQPHIWTAFDIQPIISSGNDYLESGETVDIGFNIFNPSQLTFSPVELSLTSGTDDGFFGSFSTASLDFTPFATEETGYLFSGEIGEFP